MAPSQISPVKNEEEQYTLKKIWWICLYLSKEMFKNKMFMLVNECKRRQFNDYETSMVERFVSGIRIRPIRAPEGNKI